MSAGCRDVSISGYALPSPTGAHPAGQDWWYTRLPSPGALADERGTLCYSSGLFTGDRDFFFFNDFYGKFLLIHLSKIIDFGRN